MATTIRQTQSKTGTKKINRKGWEMQTELAIKEEMRRRKTKRDDLLQAFEDKGELNTRQVMDIAGTGMSSRIKELKKKGHRIVARYERPGMYRYLYLGNSRDEAA